MSFMYKSIGAKRSNWQLSQNNQYVSYALLSLGGSIARHVIPKRVYFNLGKVTEVTKNHEKHSRWVSDPLAHTISMPKPKF